jgi:two-component system KDP operon response regulator KdpE
MPARSPGRLPVDRGSDMSGAGARILVVEDDRPMQRLLCRTLELAGYHVEVAGDALTALSLLAAVNADLILLDVLLPGMSGVELCRLIRERSSVPIVILSALGREDDKVRGLDAGADDYVTKPFAVAELLARLRAVMRRSGWGGVTVERNGPLRVADLEIDPVRYLVRRESKVVPVTPLEFRLLAYLVANAGRVVTHNMVLTSVWGPEYADELHMLRVNISRLRQKLGTDADELIVTVPGVGYTVPNA